MAACDYYLCDVCECKLFYDANVDWEAQAPRMGAIIAICRVCAKDFSFQIVTVKGRKVRLPRGGGLHIDELIALENKND